jgi:hypothetical protein
MTTHVHTGHASAVARLGIARDEEDRLGEVLSAAVGDSARVLAESRLSAGHAAVAAREEWLSWVDLGESLEPWADGEWAPGLRAAAARDHRMIEDRIERGEKNLRRAVAALEPLPRRR